MNMKVDAELLNNLKEIGWYVVLTPEDEEGPSFAFTIGLYHSFQHPEVLILGLGIKTMHELVNNIGSEVRMASVTQTVMSRQTLSKDTIARFGRFTDETTASFWVQRLVFTNAKSFQLYNVSGRTSKGFILVNKGL